MWRRFAEGVLKVYLVVGGISVFILACAMGSGADSFLVFLITAMFGTIIMLLGGMILGLFTEAVRYLEIIADNTNRLGYFNSSSQQIPYASETGKLNLSAAANSVKNTQGEWRCRNCDARNPANAIFCKSCGTHK